MASRSEQIRGYAQAMLEVAEAEDVLDAVEDELFRFAKTAAKDPRLREALTDIALPAERKRALLAELLGEKANPHTVNLLAFIVEQGRARELGSIVEELVKLAAERRKHVVAEVRTAVPLEEDRRKRLAQALSKATGKTVELKVLVDPSVVGGVVARVGDRVLDGSLRRRLEIARERLREV
ncbi:MAG: ATP synthase F1 subunit delta [Actinomycetota bacterium]